MIRVLSSLAIMTLTAFMLLSAGCQKTDDSVRLSTPVAPGYFPGCPGCVVNPTAGNSHYYFGRISNVTKSVSQAITNMMVGCVACYSSPSYFNDATLEVQIVNGSRYYVSLTLGGYNFTRPVLLTGVAIPYQSSKDGAPVSASQQGMTLKFSPYPGLNFGIISNSGPIDGTIQQLPVWIGFKGNTFGTTTLNRQF
jgi:hypothetical protein